MRRERFEENRKNKNNLSYWFGKVKDCGIRVPETHIIPMDYNLFVWLFS